MTSTIRIYDYESDVFDKLVRYYAEKLKATKNWHSLQKTNNVHLYVLARTVGQNQRSDDTIAGIFDQFGIPRPAELKRLDNTIAGIFVLVKSDENISLLNIVGSVPFINRQIAS